MKNNIKSTEDVCAAIRCGHHDCETFKESTTTNTNKQIQVIPLNCDKLFRFRSSFKKNTLEIIGLKAIGSCSWDNSLKPNQIVVKSLPTDNNNTIIIGRVDLYV